MIKKIIHKIFSPEVIARYFLPYTIFIKTTKKKKYPICGKHVDLNGPLILDPKYVELDDYTRLQSGVNVISSGGKLIVHKYSAIGAGCIIIPGSHTPTVGLPQYLSSSHINDKQSNIEIGEDCWIGAGCILLSHCNIGRGAIVAAGSVVTKHVPPYSVVAGSPAKVIAARFNKEQIKEHETSLYPKDERMTEQDINNLFEQELQGKRTIGTNELNVEDCRKLKAIKEANGIPCYE